MSKFNFLKKIGIFNALAVTLIGCNFNPGQNVPAGVYGPPPMEQGDEYDPSENIPEAIYGPPVIDEDEIIVDEYDNSDSKKMDPGFVINDDFDPEHNIADEVYGPPPGDEYDPENNIPDEVYGPPPGEEE